MSTHPIGLLEELNLTVNNVRDKSSVPKDVLCCTRKLNTNYNMCTTKRHKTLPPGRYKLNS